MAKTSDAIKIIDKKTRNDPELDAMVAEASINAEVAQLIYEARTKAGLTQKQLAELVGTKQPVIARLEPAFLTNFVTAVAENLMPSWFDPTRNQSQKTTNC